MYLLWSTTMYDSFSEKLRLHTTSSQPAAVETVQKSVLRW